MKLIALNNCSPIVDVRHIIVSQLRPEIEAAIKPRERQAKNMAIIRMIRRAQIRANEPRIKANPNPYHVFIRRDIPYRNDDNPYHLLDVYSPDESPELLPVIVEIHGGGYLSCNKEINAQHGQYLASKGFHVVNMNYSLCPEFGLDDILNELTDVLSWIKDNAERYGFNTGQVALTGDSSGGHIVLLAAAVYTSGKSADYFRVPAPAVKPAAYTASCPEASFRWDLLPKTMAAKTLFFLLHRYTFDPECVKYASYDYYMDEQYPKVWFCTSPTDVLLYDHTSRLHEYMLEHGIGHEYREYTAAEGKLDHVFNVLAPDLPESRAANDDMIEFMRNQFHAKAG